MKKSQRTTKDWIIAVAEHMKLSPSKLATSAGVAASTVTRYLNDTTGSIGVSQRTLDAIAAYSGIAVHKMPGIDPAGLRDQDAIPYTKETIIPGWSHTAIETITNNTDNTEVWIAKGWTLDIAGIIPDDFIIIDRSRKPRHGDIVLAKIYDLNGQSPQTILRIYEPPYLMCHSAKLGVQRPLMVDDHSVSINGVCAGVFRLKN